MSVTIDSVYRDWNTPSVPSSGDYKPRKPEVRALLKQIQNSGGLAVTRNTYAALASVTPPTENYMGVVLDDPDATKNGYYSRVAAAWVRERGFPDTFAKATFSGTGTAQTMTFESGVNPASVLVYFGTVLVENTGAFTLDGVDVVNAAGNALSAGEWTGTVIFFLNGDGDYQLLFDAGAAASAAQSATDAAAEKTYAEEWAQSATPISVAAGGDASTDRSSKYWSEQAAAVMTTVLDPQFATLAAAQAYSPVAAPDYIRTAGYSNAGDGGGALYKKAASEPSHAGKFSITLSDGVTVVWYELADLTRVPLQVLGGMPGENCIAAMDAAIAMSASEIIVPDGAILGRHEIASVDTMAIRGGSDVVFDPLVNAAGIYLGTAINFELTGFKDAVLKTHPLSGGDIANAHMLFGLLPGCDVTNLTITGNSVTGGRIGISVGFESDRILRGICTVAFNVCKKQNGADGGEGYGIHYANAGDTGQINILYNRVEESGRHAFYGARNKRAPIFFSGNVSKDHRKNLNTTGQIRVAMTFSRCKNVMGFGNVIEDFYDGALMFAEEPASEGAVEPLDGADCSLFGTVIRNPKNTTPAIFSGFQETGTTSRVRNILMDGITFESSLFGSALLQYAWGLGVSFKNIDITYRDVVAAGATRMFILQGNSVSDTQDLSIEHVRIHLIECSTGSFSIMRPAGNFPTSQMRMRANDIKIVENTLGATVNDWEPTVAMTNAEIEVSGFASAAAYAAGVLPKGSINPSGVTRGGRASSAWNPGEVPAGEKKQINVTVPDAVLGDFAVASYNANIGQLTISAAVVATNTVTVTLSNDTGAGVTPTSGTVRVLVIKN